MIDLGANRGGFSSLLRAKVPGTYHAVEANPALIQGLQRQPYASVRNCAVTGGATSVTLSVAENDEASSILSLQDSLFNAVETVEVEGRRLDSLLAEFTGFIDVLKVDIEGAEIDALPKLPPEALLRIGQISVEFHCAPVFGFASAPSSSAEGAARDAIAGLERHGFLALAFAPHFMDVLFINRDHFSVTAQQAMLWGQIANWTRRYTTARHVVGRRLPPRVRNGWGWYRNQPGG